MTAPSGQSDTELLCFECASGRKLRAIIPCSLHRMQSPNAERASYPRPDTFLYLSTLSCSFTPDGTTLSCTLALSSSLWTKALTVTRSQTHGAARTSHGRFSAKASTCKLQRTSTQLFGSFVRKGAALLCGPMLSASTSRIFRRRRVR